MKVPRLEIRAAILTRTSGQLLTASKTLPAMIRSLLTSGIAAG